MSAVKHPSVLTPAEVEAGVEFQKRQLRAAMVNAVNDALEAARLEGNRHTYVTLAENYGQPLVEEVFLDVMQEITAAGWKIVHDSPHGYFTGAILISFPDKR